jgi:hypothetical protein
LEKEITSSSSFFVEPIILVLKREQRRVSLILNFYQTIHSCDSKPFLNQEQQRGIDNPQLYTTTELHIKFKHETRMARDPSVP